MESSESHWIDRSDKRHRYMMLSRFRHDCEYYLRIGATTPHSLWAHTEQEHIDLMRRIWNSFEEDDRPEWISLEDINAFENRMLQK